MKNLLINCLGYIKSNWKTVVFVFVVFCICILSFGYQPEVIKNHANPLEIVSIDKISNADNPWYRAVNAPYYLVARTINLFIDNPLVAGRATSAIFGMLAMILFFIVIKRWFNARMATVATMLLMTNSLLINLTHQAIPISAIILAITLVFASLNWLVRSNKYVFLSFLTFVIALSLSMYVPYMIYIVTICVLYVIIYSRNKLKKLKIWQFAIAGLVYLVLLAPLFYSLLAAPGQLREFFGINQSVATLPEYFNNLISLLFGIFVYSKSFPLLYVSNLPLLDIFTATMFVMGVYYFVRRLKYKRTVLVFSCTLTLLLILPLSAAYQTHILILLPLLYLFVITGIIELLKRWFSYFPRNPLARTTGILLVTLAICLASFFQVSRYYVAWSRSPDTKALYVIKYKQVK